LSISPIEAQADRIALVVVGAHLSVMPLNPELTALGARLERSCSTAAEYRLYELPGAEPRKPGLLRVPPGEGEAIAVEVWSLTPAAFGLFVSRIPAPLGIGSVLLDDGTQAKGFLVEAVAVRNARDITAYGGWEAYRASVLSVAV
jgi:allophanate hydrolase